MKIYIVDFIDPSVNQLDSFVVEAQDEQEAEKLMRLFSLRLKELMDENSINQVELSAAMGLSRSTVNKWVTQKAIPRMGIIEKLASYFGVPKSYFLEENGKTNERTYYLDPETAALAQELKDNPGGRVLFDAGKGLKPESVKEVMRFIEFQKAKEAGDVE